MSTRFILIMTFASRRSPALAYVRSHAFGGCLRTRPWTHPTRESAMPILKNVGYNEILTHGSHPSSHAKGPCPTGITGAPTFCGNLARAPTYLRSCSAVPIIDRTSREAFSRDSLFSRLKSIQIKEKGRRPGMSRIATSHPRCIKGTVKSLRQDPRTTNKAAFIVE